MNQPLMLVAFTIAAFWTSQNQYCRSLTAGREAPMGEIRLVVAAKLGGSRSSTEAVVPKRNTPGNTGNPRSL